MKYITLTYRNECIPHVMQRETEVSGFTKNEAALHTAEQEKFPLYALSNSEQEWLL